MNAFSGTRAPSGRVGRVGLVRGRAGAWLTRPAPRARAYYSLKGNGAYENREYLLAGITYFAHTYFKIQHASTRSEETTKPGVTKVT
jgi:hypothetical protein